MGYLLNSLSNLPIDEAVTFYIFVVDGPWANDHTDMLTRNFNHIAREIGDNAIIARGLTRDFDNELCQKYFGKEWPEVFPYLPALLLTDTHPEQLTETSLRLVVPFNHAEKTFGDLSTFFRELSTFAVSRNSTFLDHFENRTDWLSEANEVIKISPSCFGIGVNVNELIKKLRAKRA